MLPTCYRNMLMKLALRLNCFGKGNTNAKFLYIIHAESIAEEVQ
jgi:hypothetical protein